MASEESTEAQGLVFHDEIGEITISGKDSVIYCLISSGHLRETICLRALCNIFAFTIQSWRILNTTRTKKLITILVRVEIDLQSQRKILKQERRLLNAHLVH